MENLAGGEGVGAQLEIYLYIPWARNDCGLDWPPFLNSEPIIESHGQSVARANASELRRTVESANRILLTGPVGPDGDSIGACLALAMGIRTICGTPVVVAGTMSHRYSTLPGAFLRLMNWN